VTRLTRALLAAAIVVLGLGEAQARPWGWLGVRIRDMSEPEMDEVARRHGIGEGFGVVIVEVIDDTPAARAGMKPGDIVVAFEGRPVTDTRLLQRLIARAPLEDDVRLTVLRREGRTPLPVRLVTMPRPVAGERVAAEFGFVIREPDGATGPAARGPSDGAPAVTFVAKGSAADKAGLVVGDVIVQVNDHGVLTREAAREALGDLSPERPLRLTVRREGGPVSLTIPAPDDRLKP
jgi:serine protease Do